MTSLAALVLGSALTVTAGAVDALPPAPPPDPRALKRAQRAERRRHTMAVVHTVVGVGLEIGAALFYAETAIWFFGDDDMPSSGCQGGSNSCGGGTPAVLLFPVGAIAMGVVGATQLSAGREAAIWNSPIFWAGAGVQLATLVFAAGFATDPGNHKLAADTTFIVGSLVGTVLQVVGAATAPPRDVEVVAHAPRVTPACGPTAGGMMCGLALAGF